MANILNEQIAKIKERMRMIEEQSFESPEGPSVPNEIPLDLDYVDYDSALIGVNTVRLVLMKMDDKEDIVLHVHFGIDYSAREAYPVSAEQIEPIHRKLNDEQFGRLMDDDKLSDVIYSYEGDILRAKADEENEPEEY